MADCGQRSLDIRHHDAHRIGLRSSGAVDHDHRNSKRAGSFDFRKGRRTAGVFRDDHLDPVALQHVNFIGKRKGSTRRDVARIRNFKRRFHRIDAADQIAVLGRGFKGQELLSAKRQKSVCAGGTQCGGCFLDASHVQPTVALPRNPGQARQSDKSDACYISSPYGIGRNARRIRMRRIHQQIETFLGNIARQALCAAKAAGAHRDGLLDRVLRAARHGQQNSVAGVFGELSSQNAGIRRTAENEDGACHGS